MQARCPLLFSFIRIKRELILRFLKFSIVGGSGVLVNLGSLAFFHKIVGFPFSLSLAMAIEISIVNNFFWNNLWTWRERRRDPVYQRFLKYNIATLTTSGIGNFLTSVVVKGLGVHYIIAGMAGIVVAVLINFLLADRWVFRR